MHPHLVVKSHTVLSRDAVAKSQVMSWQNPIPFKRLGHTFGTAYINEYISEYSNYHQQSQHILNNKIHSFQRN